MTEDEAAQLAQDIIRQCNDAGRPGVGIAFGNYAGHHSQVAAALADARDVVAAFATLPGELQIKARSDAQEKAKADAKAAIDAAAKARTDAEAAAARAAEGRAAADAAKAGNLDALLDALAARMAQRSAAAPPAPSFGGPQVPPGGPQSSDESKH